MRRPLHHVGRSELIETASSGALAITCSGLELYFLSALVGGRSLVGVEDPFPGWPAEEIPTALQAATESLEARRYLETLPDGTLRVDETAALMAAIVAFPSAVAMVTRSDSAEPEQRTYFLRPPVAIELAAASGEALLEESGAASDGESVAAARLYDLLTVAGPAAVAQRIRDLWQIGGVPAAPGAPALVPESVMRQAQQEALSLDAAGLGSVEEVRTRVQGLLTQAGIPAATAESLAVTLMTARQNGAFVAMRPGDSDWQMAGMAILGGAGGLWRLATVERDGTPWLDVRPMAGDQVLREIETILTRAAPEDQGPPI